MHVFAPVLLDQEIAFKHALYNKVILLVALVKQGLLDNGELAFLNS